MAAYAVHKVREAGSALDGVGTEACAIVFDAAGAHVAAAASRRMEQSAGDLPNGRLAAGMDDERHSGVVVDHRLAPQV